MDREAAKWFRGVDYQNNSGKLYCSLFICIAFDWLLVLVYIEARYYCSQVKAEAVKVEKYDEPIHKLIVDLISGLHITKLVMGLTFMKSSSSSWYAIALPYNPTFLVLRF